MKKGKIFGYFVFILLVIFNPYIVNASTTGTVVVDDYLNVRSLVGGDIINKLGNGSIFNCLK